jgi:hypothetical protein
MTYTEKLSARVAATALVAFAASFFLFSAAPWAQEEKDVVNPNTPKYGGARNQGQITSEILNSLKDGAVIIVLKPVDVTTTGSGEITAYTFDAPSSSGRCVWYNGQLQGGSSCPFPVPTTPTTTYGLGDVKDIKIYTGSNCCTDITLGGVPLRVCKPC